jgi:N-acetylglucosaminyl-diphospho-decaprenol L-rhamnosyltransferase
MSEVVEHAVSVVVPVYNQTELVLQTLAAVPPGVELVVVDDASTDGVADRVAREHPRARLLRNERNVGFAASANRGLRAAHGAVRIVLNSDARPLPGAVESLVQAFHDPRVGVAGPRLVFPDGTHQVSAAAFPTPGSTLTGSFLLNEIYRGLWPDRRFRYELGLARRDHDQDRDVDWVHGTCVAISERCLRDVGGFDESYRFLVEEMDLCWRAQRAGWHIRYVAGSVVEHEGGASSADQAARARRYIVGEARFMARAYGQAVLPRWRAARIVGAVVKMLVLAPGAVLSARLRRPLVWQLSSMRTVLGGSWARTVAGPVVVLGECWPAVEFRRDPDDMG